MFVRRMLVLRCLHLSEYPGSIAEEKDDREACGSSQKSVVWRSHEASGNGVGYHRIVISFSVSDLLRVIFVTGLSPLLILWPLYPSGADAIVVRFHHHATGCQEKNLWV